MRRYWVYILASRTKVLYVGVTDDLARRVQEHKNGRYNGFTKSYNVNRLVYYETMSNGAIACAREKQIKGLSRAKRVGLIEARNPEWNDLTDELP